MFILITVSKIVQMPGKRTQMSTTHLFQTQALQCPSNIQHLPMSRIKPCCKKRNDRVRIGARNGVRVRFRDYY